MHNKRPLILSQAFGILHPCRQLAAVEGLLWAFREAMRGKISKTFFFRRTRPSSCPSRQLASTAAFDAWQIISRTRVICKLCVRLSFAHTLSTYCPLQSNSWRSISGRLLHSTPDSAATRALAHLPPAYLLSHTPPHHIQRAPSRFLRHRTYKLPRTRTLDYLRPYERLIVANHLQLSRPWESTIPSRHPWRVSTVPATTGTSRYTDTDEFVSPAECKKCGKILTSFVDPRQPLGPEKIIPPSVLANAKV